jgi:hypothetical protein
MDAPTVPYLVQPVVRGHFVVDVNDMLGVGAAMKSSTSYRLESTEREAHVVSSSTFVADRSQGESLTFNDVQSANEEIELSGSHDEEVMTDDRARSNLTFDQHNRLHHEVTFGPVSASRSLPSSDFLMIYETARHIRVRAGVVGSAAVVDSLPRARSGAEERQKRVATFCMLSRGAAGEINSHKS